MVEGTPVDFYAHMRALKAVSYHLQPLQSPTVAIQGSKGPSYFTIILSDKA